MTLHNGAGGATRIPGIEPLLPPGERVHWVGAPDAWSFARNALHSRKLALYFGALVVLRALTALDEPAPLTTFLDAAAWLAPLGAMTLLFVYALAKLVARTTIYAVTDRRIVMRIGVAIPVTINIPLRTVESVSLCRRPNGTGDVALTIDPTQRIAYILLWPHVRPWRYATPQPTLRAIADADDVGALVSRLAAAIATPVVAESLAVQGNRRREHVARAPAVHPPAGLPELSATP